MVERRFPRAMASLETIYSFVREFLSSNGIGDEFAFDVDLILEELFTNMVKYGGATPSDITVGLDWAAPVLTLRLEDFGAVPFDPTQAPPVDTSRPVEERRAGGLGLHLVRRLVDRLEYTHEDRRSRITITKRLDV